MTTTPVKYPREWESCNTTWARLQVPGGWLVKTWDDQRNNAICFFPDPDYSWVLKKDKSS